MSAHWLHSSWLGLVVGGLLLPGCNTAGSDWMAQPLEGELSTPPPPAEVAVAGGKSGAPRRNTRSQSIHEPTPPTDTTQSSGPGGYAEGTTAKPQLAGNVLGTF